MTTGKALRWFDQNKYCLSTTTQHKLCLSTASRTLTATSPTTDDFLSFDPVIKTAAGGDSPPAADCVWCNGPRLNIVDSS